MVEILNIKKWQNYIAHTRLLPVPVRFTHSSKVKQKDLRRILVKQGLRMSSHKGIAISWTKKSRAKMVQHCAWKKVSQWSNGASPQIRRKWDWMILQYQTVGLIASKKGKLFTLMINLKLACYIPLCQSVSWLVITFDFLWFCGLWLHCACPNGFLSFF